MNQAGTIVRLVVLLALAFCALAAQGAIAQVGTQAVNTTAVTCVKGGGDLDFKDTHCDEFVGTKAGEYGHVAIANDSTTELEVTSTTDSVLKGVIGGISAEILCKKADNVKLKSFIHNVEIEEKHTVTGTVQVLFVKCEVKKPSNCEIIEPIPVTASFDGVEGLEPLSKNEMGLELKGDGGAESTFAEFRFADEKCVLFNKGKHFSVKGSAIATGKPSAKEEHTGATAKFELGSKLSKMETIENEKNKPLEFTGSFTASMAGGGNPIALTTVT